MGKNRFSDIAAGAAQRTNEELASELSLLMPLPADKLARLLPTKADKEHMAELMAIVSARTSENFKVALLRKNIGRLGGVAVRVLKALV